MATEKQIKYITWLQTELGQATTEESTKLLSGEVASELIQELTALREATPENKPQDATVKSSIEQRQLDILKGMAIKRAAEDSENVAWIIAQPAKFLDTCTALYATYRATLQGLKEADNQQSVPI